MFLIILERPMAWLVKVSTKKTINFDTKIQGRERWDKVCQHTHVIRPSKSHISWANIIAPGRWPLFEESQAYAWQGRGGGTVVWTASNMYDDSKKVVGGIGIGAVVGGVPQLQIEWEDHSVHQFPHSAFQKAFFTAADLTFCIPESTVYRR
jgi:hypothetical protein